MHMSKIADSMTLTQAARILGTHEKMLQRYVECGVLRASDISGADLYAFGKHWRADRIENEEDEDELEMFKYIREQKRLRPYRELRENVLKMYDALMARHKQKSRMTLIKSEVS